MNRNKKYIYQTIISLLCILLNACYVNDKEILTVTEKKESCDSVTKINEYDIKNFEEMTQPLPYEQYDLFVPVTLESYELSPENRKFYLENENAFLALIAIEDAYINKIPNSNQYPTIYLNFSNKDFTINQQKRISKTMEQLYPHSHFFIIEGIIDPSKTSCFPFIITLISDKLLTLYVDDGLSSDTNGGWYYQFITSSLSNKTSRYILKSITLQRW